MTSGSDTRERVVAKAEELFEQFGPTKTTIADIARALRMSPANIYKHFACKSAIIEVVGERHMAELTARIERLADGSKPAWDRISAVVVAVARHFLARLANEKDIIQLQAIAESCHWTFVDNFDRFLHRTLADLILEGVAAGQLACDDAEGAASVLIDCLPGALDPFTLLRARDHGQERRIRAQLNLLKRAFE